jgi:hypothetical protein
MVTVMPCITTNCIRLPQYIILNRKAVPKMKLFRLKTCVNDMRGNEKLAWMCVEASACVLSKPWDGLPVGAF